MKKKLEAAARYGRNEIIAAKLKAPKIGLRVESDLFYFLKVARENVNVFCVQALQ